MNLSFQLYSARNFLPWSDVVARIAQLGYTQVEGFGGIYEDASAFRDLIDQHGLTMPSGHFFPIGELEGGVDASLAAARTLGMERIICPAPEDLWRDGTDAATWVSLAKRLHEVSKRVQDEGFRFGWHNHHWEFMPLENGALPMDLIFEHAPETEWEMDVAWVVRGGADPIKWINDHADRITAAHVKDLAPEGENEEEGGWADVGHGVMDWKTIVAALRAINVDLFVAEHDTPSDFDRFATRAIASFRQF